MEKIGVQLTDTLLDDYEIVDTKYAGLLGAADLGDDTVIYYMKQYKYRGELREKMKYYYCPQVVKHSHQSTELLAREGKGNYWREWYTLRPQDQVVVMRKVKS